MNVLADIQRRIFEVSVCPHPGPLPFGKLRAGSGQGEGIRKALLPEGFRPTMNYYRLAAKAQVSQLFFRPVVVEALHIGHVADWQTPDRTVPMTFRRIANGQDREKLHVGRSVEEFSQLGL